MLRLIAIALWVALATSLGHAATVVLVSSEGTAAYAEVAKAVRAELERGGVPATDIQEHTLADLPRPGTLSPRLFVALGSRAASVMAERDGRTPLLCAMVPRSVLERMVLSNVSRSAGLYGLTLDQPVGRQLDLIRLALPQARGLGLMWGDDSRLTVGEILSAASMRGFRPISPYVQPEEQVFSALKKVLDEADVLLALPEPHIYNSASLQNILLSTFRAKVPVVGFSPAYVRAGAVLGLFSTPEQMARQTALLARGFLAGRLPSAPVQVPVEYVVSVNEQVMHSLGLNLDAAKLTQALQRLDRQP